MKEIDEMEFQIVVTRCPHVTGELVPAIQQDTVLNE